MQLELVSGFEEVCRGSRFVDMYVTTDPSEVAEVLAPLGFSVIKYAEEDYFVVFPEYFDRDGCPTGESDYLLPLGFVNQATGMRADCIDVPLEECLGVRSSVGFTPMSKIRVGIGRVSERGAANELSSMLKGLLAERQNAAFVNDGCTRAYVVLSEFYR